ncbi:NUDIX hydrolase [Mesorhizobium sp. M00.F.Ca.ET.186.01.1.1]|nr:NUDIX hydrolase [bacterium M00.F.Ca.ET.205.01.1.1]TGU48221.1 NUDIX hydrolase [bacterium M00.F.Ca.ET.152.01.1.1]TGV32460.1 NUDIX hydrolase [Mesorhizobium sp. M00.F.Ca.ET.186.01.1.1]TGZ39673.1 NUDIX hydrolase [bacterium M00.F.Ca.ET.162.01.1.1]TIW62941.1 MAG: NUDIX hydrolase [Mesorhizobium sp.]
MTKNLTVTVGALLVSHDRKVLLGLRAAWKSAWPGHWDTVGGRVEAGETLDAALVREVQEEIGVTPTQFRWMESIEERRPDLYGNAVHHVFAVVGWDGGNPSNVCEEHTEIRWFDIDELQHLSNLVDCDYPRLAKRAST